MLFEEKKKKKSRKQEEMTELASKAFRFLKAKAHLGDDGDLMPFQYVAKQEEKLPVVHLKVSLHSLYFFAMNS